MIFSCELFIISRIFEDILLKNKFVLESNCLGQTILLLYVEEFLIMQILHITKLDSETSSKKVIEIKKL